MNRKAIADSLIPTVLLFVLADAAAGIGGNGQYSTKVVHTAAKLYRIDVSYPYFAGITNAAELNSSVLQLAREEIVEFKNGTSSSVRSTLNGKFEVAAATNELVSVRFLFENRCPPSGRPAEDIVEFNYSPQLKQPLSLEEIFRGSVKYENLFSAISFDKLIDKEEIESWETATETDKGLFHDFSLTKTGIDLHFGSSVGSSVRATVMSDHAVHIPWSRIRSLLSPDSPVYAIAKSAHDSSHQTKVTENNLDSQVAEIRIHAYSKAIARFPKQAHLYKERAEWRTRIGQTALAAADSQRAEQLEAEQRRLTASAASTDARAVDESTTQAPASPPSAGRAAARVSSPGLLMIALSALVIFVLPAAWLVIAWRRRLQK